MGKDFGDQAARSTVLSWKSDNCVRESGVEYYSASFV